MCSQSDPLPSAQTIIDSWISWAKDSAAQNVELVEWGKRDEWPLIGLTMGNRTSPGPVVYISAGMHGDEPAGVLALQEWIRQAVSTLHGTWILAPLLNPGGWDRRSRENPESIDLNRDYGTPQSIEVKQHQRWLESLPQVDLFLSLHEDYEAEGFYLYCLDNPKLGYRILDSVARVMPLQPGNEVDGHALSEGLIQTGNPAEILKEMPSWPEALWMYDRFPKASNLTSETPSCLDLPLRIAAQKQVLDTVRCHLQEVCEKIR